MFRIYEILMTLQTKLPLPCIVCARFRETGRDANPNTVQRAYTELEMRGQRGRLKLVLLSHTALKGGGTPPPPFLIYASGYRANSLLTQASHFQ